MGRIGFRITFFRDGDSGRRGVFFAGAVVVAYKSGHRQLDPRRLLAANWKLQIAATDVVSKTWVRRWAESQARSCRRPSQLIRPREFLREVCAAGITLLSRIGGAGPGRCGRSARPNLRIATAERFFCCLFFFFLATDARQFAG